MRTLGNKVAARNLAVSAGVPVMPATAAAARRSRTSARSWPREIGYPVMLKAQLGRRRARHARHRRARRARASCCRRRGARRRPPSATTRSISRSWSRAPATSRCRSSATRTATSCTCSSATARCSGATRRWSSARRRRILEPRPARASSATRRSRSAAPPTTATPARSSSCRTPTPAASTSSRSIRASRSSTRSPRWSPASTSSRRRSTSPTARASATPRERRAARRSEIRLNGHALQCRITTEDPENNFIPDYGRITAYRSAAGFGIRLDGGTAYSGAVITRFYDSLLEKVTAWAPTPEEAIARMDRALREFRIRGVATNLRFLENVITHPRFRAATTRRASSTRRRSCSQFAARRDRATQLLTYIADVTVNGNPEARGRAAPPAAVAPRCRRRAVGAPPPRRHASSGSTSSGRERFASWMLGAEARAGHRHDACATRTSRCSRRACARYDMLRDRAGLRARCCRSCSRSNAGAARPSTSPCASCSEDPWERLARAPRGDAEHPAADAAARRPTPSATPTIPTTWCASSCSRRRPAASISSASSTP